MNKILKAQFIAVLAAGIVTTAMADEFDGTENLLCAVQEVHSCMPFSKCEPTPPDPVDVPYFIKVEINRKKISDMLDKGDDKQIAIERQKVTKNGLFLQGHENYAWTMAISRKNGRFSLTAMEADYSFVIFGACTIP